jgi:hypothetical protein
MTTEIGQIYIATELNRKYPIIFVITYVGSIIEYKIIKGRHEGELRYRTYSWFLRDMLVHYRLATEDEARVIVNEQIIKDIIE